MAVIERGDSYYVRVYKGGSYHYVGTFPFKEYGGKRAAQDAAKEAEADAKRALGTSRTKETCRSFAVRWPKDYTIVKKGPTRGRRKTDATLRGYAEELQSFIAEYGTTKLSDAQYDRPRARRFATEHPRSAVVARNMLSDAVDDGLIDNNPFSGLNLEEPRGRSDYPAITEEELHDLADTSLVVHGGRYGPVYRGFVLWTGYVGARLNEGLNVERRDMRPSEREVDLRVTKLDKPRTVLLLPEATDALRDVVPRTNHERVFYAKRGGPLSKGAHQPIWDPIRKVWWAKLSEARRQELVDFDFHSLRHFCGHYFYIVRGFGAEAAAYQLGHSDPQLIIKRYGKPFQGALDRLKRLAAGNVTPISVASETKARGKGA